MTLADPSLDTLDVAALNGSLAGSIFAGNIHHFPTITSTNSHAMLQAEQGAPHGSVYVADEQTGGRGRGSHGWHSQAGAGLYVSILLRPKLAPADGLWLSLAAGLAAHQAVHSVTALVPDIRWPNDLLFGKKKFGGILTEMNAEVTRIRHVVIGIGMNVHQTALPAELSGIATSLAIESGRHWPRQDLLATLLLRVEQEFHSIQAPNRIDDAIASILRRLEAASSWVRGKSVMVEEEGGYSGVTEGLDPRGFLRVRTPAGTRIVFSGGVREASPRS